jgi:hypothetical protein
MSELVMRWQLENPTAGKDECAAWLVGRAADVVGEVKQGKQGKQGTGRKGRREDGDVGVVKKVRKADGDAGECGAQR